MDNYVLIHNDEYSDYLAHYGVLGMKWGVRRYQKANGALTDAGKKRISKTFAKSAKKADKLTKISEKRNAHLAKSYDMAGYYNRKAARINSRSATAKFVLGSDSTIGKIGSIRGARAAKKAAKYESRIARAKSAEIRANNWLKQMEKSFSSVSIKDIDSSTLEYGKKYAKYLAN